ncbi:MAG TPA: hypothetical protein VGI56_09965 [Galbitalea sp.]
MARIRSIRPEFWVDDKIVDLSLLAKLLFIGLWNFADDDGYIEDSERRIKRMVFPDNNYDIRPAIAELVKSGVVSRATSDQGQLLHVVNLAKWQKPQHPTPTKFTNIKGNKTLIHEDSREDMNPPEASSRRGKESRGKEGNVAEIRPDVSRLCTILADLIEANGSKRPSIGKGWLDSARLLIDLDKRPLGEAISMIQWCQADPFWRANIMSMPKFRDKYDTLRLQRTAKTSEPPVTPQTSRRVVSGRG